DRDVRVHATASRTEQSQINLSKLTGDLRLERLSYPRGAREAETAGGHALILFVRFGENHITRTGIDIRIRHGARLKVSPGGIGKTSGIGTEGEILIGDRAGVN